MQRITTRFLLAAAAVPFAAAAVAAGCYPVPAQPPPEAAPQPTAQPAPQPQPVAQAVVVQPQPTAQPVTPQPTAQGVHQPQQAVQHTSSNFGTVALAPGFVPDPHTTGGTSGGSQAARSRDSRCRGWISSTPDHLFQATGAFQSLRIIASSSADTTLVVQRPDGGYLCNDDAEGRNPIVQGSFAPGTYAVWVGSYRQGEMAQYRLGFTELASVTAASIGGGAAAAPAPSNTSSNFGTVSLAPGFTPDPAIARGVSGGQVHARTLHPSCRGWISNTPDHILSAQGHFTPLRVMARSASDTTLVMQAPNGQWICDDDSGGSRNPLINRAFPAGAYRVWIGSYNQGENSRYTLGFSELSGVTPASLPAP